MPKKLSDWAKENGIKYATAYSWVKKGQFKEPTYKNEGGSIMVGNQIAQTPKPVQLTVATASKSNALGVEFFSNQIAKKHSNAQTTRSNRAADIEPLDRFANIDQVYLPFRCSYAGQNDNANINIREILILSQKAYFGYSIVRSLIDTLTLFSSSKIYLQGSTKKARDFFDAYFKSIKLEKFQEQFFREFWRSGNVFVWKLQGRLDNESLNQLSKIYGLEISKASETVKIPVLYTILNPADIEIQGAASFLYPIYYKIISDYELERLRFPATEQDEIVLKSLPPEVRKMISHKSATNILMPLNPENVSAVFNGKQDYESFAVPIIYSVLDSLEHKTQLLKIDRAIAKTAQQAVLLITMGYEGKDGSYNFNQKTAEDIQSLFANESTFKAIVCDFTTKMEFVLPQIGEILDPKKYEIINQDLQDGLGNILFSSGGGGEKFSNLSTKVKIFIEKIRSAREKFLNEFLIDEIKAISKKMGFRTYPTPHFEDIDIDDSNEFKRIINQLANMGFLTPEETFQAIETKRLPSVEESIESQKRFKDLKGEGLYIPPNSQPSDGSLSGGGRPGGTTAPQTTKNVSPIGTGETLFSLTKIQDNIAKSHLFESDLDGFLKKQFDIKDFNQDQARVKKDIINLVLASQPPENWTTESAQSIIKNKIQLDKEKEAKISGIQGEHNVDFRMAAILSASVK